MNRSMTHGTGPAGRQAAARLLQALKKRNHWYLARQNESSVFRNTVLEYHSLDGCKGVLLRRRKGAVEVAQKAFEFEQGLREGRCSVANKRAGRAGLSEHT